MRYTLFSPTDFPVTVHVYSGSTKRQLVPQLSLRLLQTQLTTADQHLPGTLWPHPRLLSV